MRKFLVPLALGLLWCLFVVGVYSVVFSVRQFNAHTINTALTVPEGEMIIKYDMDTGWSFLRNFAGLDLYFWYGNSLRKQRLDTCNKLGWDFRPGFLPENIECDNFYYNLELWEWKIRIYRSDANSTWDTKYPYLDIDIPQNIKNMHYSEQKDFWISWLGVSMDFPF